MSDDDNWQVTFNHGEEPAAEAREAVEAGIAALREHSYDFHSMRRAADLGVALATPPPPEFKRVEVATDSPAVKDADEAIAREQQAFLDAMSVDVSTPAAGEAPVFLAAGDAGVASQVFAIPYHYNWRWHQGAAGLFNLADLPSGRITLSVRANRRIDSHAGFGIGVRATHDHWMTARSLRRSSEWCRIQSGATGAVALAEGGMEMTVMEGENHVAPRVVDRRFRYRLNPGFLAAPEEVSYDTGGFDTGAPIEVRWFARAGHTYQVNVGAWVFAEWTTGPHAAGDISRSSAGVVADVLAITLFHG